MIIEKTNLCILSFLFSLRNVRLKDLQEKDSSPCLDGKCDATFVLDAVQNFGSYLDKRVFF